MIKKYLTGSFIAGKVEVATAKVPPSGGFRGALSSQSPPLGGFRGFLFALVAVFIVLSSSCKKEQVTTDKTATLAFSTDSIKFDTVFTSVGSATMNFLVRNPNKKAVVISNIRLGGGAASYFKINVDGHPGTQLTNYTLAGGDSMFVFVQVTINPTTVNGYIVTDSIMFTTNGNLQMVKLMAGTCQNAHFFASQAICSQVWGDTLKPYVIYNSIQVNPGCTLTITKGVKIYSHRGSAIFVLGAMNVIGAPYSPVIFQGDRLEQYYSTAPGQWYGIWFTTYRFASSPTGTMGTGSFTNAVIKNAVVGIETDSFIPGDTLNIYQTKIQNMATAGIFGTKGAIVTGKDLLVNNCGQFLFLGENGGAYNFAYCTFDNSDASITSSSTSITLANNPYTANPNGTGATIQYPLTANFTDCIFWGQAADEVQLDSFTGTAFMYNFKYNIIRASMVKFNTTNKINTDPLFKDAYNGNYHFASMSSPAIGFGKDTLGVTVDIDNATRLNKPNVVGCYVQ